MNTLTRRRPLVAGLIPVERAREILRACKTVDEAKGIRDRASAIAAYLRTQKASREAQLDAGEIGIRAERRLGELLAEQKAKGERQRPGDAKRLQRATIAPPRLSDMGIEKTAAARWQEMARIPEPKLERYISEQRASSAGEITRAGLRTAVLSEQRRGERLGRAERLAAAAPPIEGVRPAPLILADPPWRYEHVKTGSRAVENHYPTMSIEEICELQVPAADDSLLYLWTTAPKLSEAFRVLDAWRFVLTSGLVWHKTGGAPGMGYFARIDHEHLLIAKRGSGLPPPSPSARTSSVIAWPRSRRHSEKPPAFYELIERAYPRVDKLELFARAARPGWRAWGNEAPRAGGSP